MISIVISEKGGAERREVYDQDEITVGRVKGNDVLLPKGNVSKRHARLIMRDGRFIVTDLKSTNGTYVNHRRITHATLVREGDRIYIGDFILRIEGAARDGAPSQAVETPSSIPLSPGLPARPTHDDVATPSGESSAGANTRSGAVARATIPPGAAGHEEIVSHFPIENDPDDSQPMIDVPGPPRVPSGLRAGSSSASVPVVSTVDHPVLDSVSPAPGAIIPPVSSSGQFSSKSDGAHPSDQTPPAKSSTPVVEDSRRVAQREALAELCDDVENDVGGELLDELPRPKDEVAARVTEAIERHAAAIPAGDVEPAALREAARRELLELGPLDGLLEDDAISRIRVSGCEVTIQRRGQPASHDGPSFGTPAGLLRAIRRLCADAGQPVAEGESLVERELSGGRLLSALLPPAAADGPVLLVRRTRREQVTLNGLVRSGAISRGMATLLAHCMAARANVLVSGPPDHGLDEVLSALAHAVPKSAQVLAIGDELGRAVRLVPSGDELEQAKLVRAAARMAPDHLVAAPLGGKPLAALLDAVADGAIGVVLASPAPTLRQALDRLAADVSGARDIGVSTALAWIGGAFDLGVEVSRLKDGRVRVVRIAELKGGAQAGQRDIFTFAYHRTAAGGAIEGSFYASGIVPRIVEDLAARGLPLDTTIFRRHPSS